MTYLHGINFEKYIDVITTALLKFSVIYSLCCAKYNFLVTESL